LKVIYIAHILQFPTCTYVLVIPERALIGWRTNQVDETEFVIG